VQLPTVFVFVVVLAPGSRAMEGYKMRSMAAIGMCACAWAVGND